MQAEAVNFYDVDAVIRYLEKGLDSVDPTVDKDAINLSIHLYPGVVAWAKAWRQHAERNGRDDANKAELVMAMAKSAAWLAAMLIAESAKPGNNTEVALMFSKLFITSLMDMAPRIDKVEANVHG